MADIVDVKTRSRMMSGIRAQDTKPEMTIRKGLYQRGFRYRLHKKEILGRPDLVLAKYSTLIFVNGCFWHQHDCKFFKMPKSNREFWQTKLRSNKLRDEKNQSVLLKSNWYIAIVWECSIRNKAEKDISALLDRLSAWLTREKYRKRVLEFR